MIGVLPKSLESGGKHYPINSDFRVALLIFEAFDDAELNDFEKFTICLKCLYREVPEDTEEAYRKAVWFLDGGDAPKPKGYNRKMIDWKQDESIIFPAVNKVAGTETRTLEYMHWWSFLGLFGEIGDGLFAQVMNIRHKKAKGKKIEKYEREFYSANKALIDVETRYSAEEQAEIDRLNELLGD